MRNTGQFLMVLVTLLLISSPVRANTALIEYSSKIKDEPVEYLYVFNPGGFLIFGLRGDDHHVIVPSHYYPLLPDTITIHNHPNGITEFSSQDIDFFRVSGSSEMWVVTNNSLLIMKKDGSVSRQIWDNPTMISCGIPDT